MTQQFLLRLCRAVLVLSVVALQACSGGQNAAPPGGANAAPEVGVIVARPSSMAVTVELPGRLEAYRQAEVRARVAGIVTERLYEEGETVRKGKALFLIDPAPMKATLDVAAGALARAEANHASAADKVKRYEELLVTHTISERAHTEAIAEERQSSAELASARAEWKSARLQLGYATVTAPIDGRARRALVTEGALVGQDSATPLTMVEQIDPIYVNFSQPASDVTALHRAVREGQLQGVAQKDVKVKLILADGSAYSQAGTLLFSDLAVDPGTDTVAMRALFPNPQQELLPGGYVQVRLDQATNTAAIAIPRDALIRSATSASVMVVGADDKVAAVEVTANSMSGQHWLVTSGLKGGERVIVENAAMMAPGTIVKAVDRQAAVTPASPAPANAAPEAAKGRS